MRVSLSRAVIVASVTFLAATAAVVPVTQAGAGATVSAAKAAPVPAMKSFSSAIEPYAEYNGQSLCDPVSKPGVLKVADLLRRTYGGYDIGIVRACGVGGTSEHKEGRALDWMVSKRVPEQKAAAKAFLDWLLAPDQFGNSAAMARRLGVMYIGWNNKMWRAYDPDRGTNGWDDLKSCTTSAAMKATSYDTYCHRNHIHLSFSWDGADAQTSYWTMRPLTVPVCERRTAVQAVAHLGSGDDPHVVLDTGSGAGTAAGIPCRIGADRWEGDERRLKVHLPVTGAQTVRLRVERYASNAPAALKLKTAAGKASVGARTALPRTVDLPVGANGVVTVRTTAGEASVRIVGLGSPSGSPDTTPPPSTATPRVSLEAPAVVVSGRTLALHGTVSGVPAGAVVKRYLKVGKGTWAARGAAVTPQSGQWRMTTTAPTPQKLRYRAVVLVGGKQVAHSTKRVVLVTAKNAKPRTSLHAPARAATGATFVLTGAVKDSPAGVTVRRYLKVGNAYEPRGPAVTPAGAKRAWRMSVEAPSSAGPLVYRIAVLHKGQVIGWSKVKTVAVA